MNDEEKESDARTSIAGDVRDKSLRLFTYLEKALSLDDTVTRDFRLSAIQPSLWWLADYPNDSDNLFIRSFDTEKEVVELEQSSAWLRVQKKSIESAPALPERLVEWVTEITPMDRPMASEKIDRKVRFDSDKDRVGDFKKFRKNFEQGVKVPESLVEWVTVSPGSLPEVIEVRHISDNWTDHPELENLLIGYIENEWKQWSDKVIKTYRANLLYDQLYALRLLLKNEGDSYELLLGHGLLTWKHSAVGEIYSPIFFIPLALDFDASKRTIEINPDPMFRNFVEIAPTSEMDNPAEVDLDKWMSIINSDPFDFWHLETLKSQANTFLNYLSPNGENCFSDEITSTPTITENPSIWNSPVIFVRKRTNSLWAEYARAIKRDIEQNETRPTEFINDLIGVYQKEAEQVNPEETVKEIPIAEPELFFPLPWNDEQKRIAERMETNYGVVVKGPPGTGKSHTIANLIARFLAQGKSVLVTSQTSKALEVLREKLPENIRSLAVSQLHQTAKRDGILQQSIAEISSNLGERHTKFSEAKVELVRKELESVREEKASVANLIRQYILSDSTETLEINGEKITPIEAAKLISKYAEDPSLSWFIDKVHFEAKLNFSVEDLKKVYQLLIDLNENDRNLHEFELPDFFILPDEDLVSATFSSYRELAAKAENSNEIFEELANNFNQEALLDLLEMVNDAHKVLLSINENYEREIFDKCTTSSNTQEEWSEILTKIEEKIQAIHTSKKKIFGHSISSLALLELNDLADAVDILRSKVSDNHKLGAFGKLILPVNAKEVLKNYTVDDRSPDTSERLDVLHEKIVEQLAEREIRIVLEQGFSSLRQSVDFDPLKDDLDIVGLEILASNIGRIVNYRNNFSKIGTSFKNVKQFSDLSYISLKDIETSKKLLESGMAKFELMRVEKAFEEWIKLIGSPTGASHDIFEKLTQSIKKRNVTAWKRAVEELSLLTQNKGQSVQLNEIAKRIKKFAPDLYQDIVGLADQKQKFDCPNNLELAWKVARLKSWLDHIHDHASIDDLQNRHERLSRREFQLNSDLVTILAWQRQIDKVTKQQRDALMAWSDSMKKYGKGTGKWAHKNLIAAQESLKEAKNAVPVWIMPLYRAVQMFSDPKAGMFDVVIFDEASQCDIRGLTIGYLGKKLLVVGDPDQISPAGLFQDMERVYELISRFLYDIPHRNNFSITSSLFDLAKIRISSMIQLNEHFRCVPEIIAFSNHYIYEGKLKPLRYPHPKGLLKPALVPVLVEAGYQNTNNKENRPEAEAIVEKIAECLGDSNYQKRPDGRLCTFGVISLLADDQAKYIKGLLLRHPKIGEKVIEERNITCGDAYAFQGDERDVIFLSMVKALDSNNPKDTVKALVDKSTSQRFNVAATRGRDQVFLYHSIPVQEFKNKDDWRYRILNWYYDPKTEELKAGRQALKKEYDSGKASQFSFDVGNILIDRGYQVLPEYPVIGYRIDLVVQGENARLAVECDGDQYHTLENWEENWVRERQLRRAGWEFWRVTGSAFYRYKEKALESLWEKLDEMGIKPIVGS